MNSGVDFCTRLAGIVTVLNTPFSDDGRIDFAGLRRNVTRAIDAGVSGFLVPALAGEVGSLSADERCAIVAAVVQENAGRVAVIGGASAGTQLERKAYAKLLLGIGCDCVLVSLPYVDETTWERELRDLVDEVAAPLMIQDWAPAGYGVPVSVAARLFAEIPSFVSMKVEVVPAGPKYSQLLTATGGRLHVSGGWAVTQMIEALDRGVHTFMPTGMHEIYCEMYRRYRSGHRDAAIELFRRVLPVLAFANQHLDISIHFFKRLLWKEGLYATPRTRDPILPFDEIHRRTADELIDLVTRITASVQAP